MSGLPQEDYDAEEDAIMDYMVGEDEEEAMVSSDLPWLGRRAGSEGDGFFKFSGIYYGHNSLTFGASLFDPGPSVSGK